MAGAVTRAGLSARELRAMAARRMLVIARVLDGVDRRTAAEGCGMDRQTFRGLG